MQIVKTEQLELRLPPEGFLLESGERLPQIVVAYERYGELAPDGRNVVYVCHALTGDAHVAGYRSEDPKSAGWWQGLIGPGCGLDTDKYQVVCANVLGGCSGTTGPTSINPATGKPYGNSFPLLHMKDAVRVERLLLEQLGVKHLAAVIGGSLGGMRALEWGINHSDFVDRVIAIASGASLSPQALAFDIIQREEIEDDPDFRNGDYLAHGTVPARGLSRARQIGHVTYLSSQTMAAKFGRDTRETPIPGVQSRFSSHFEVESYLNYQGQKLVDRFDAMSYLLVSRMLNVYDPAKEYGGLDRAFAQSSCQFLVVSISTDWLFPPEQQLELVRTLMAARHRVSYLRLDSPFGHDAFLIDSEVPKLARAVRAFLEGSATAAAASGATQQDLEVIRPMIPEGAYVLDVGSGDGSTFLDLVRHRKITGVCLDLDFDMIVACMSKGLCAVHLDADAGLADIPSDSFDCVLLNQTIQQLHSALQSLRQVLRIAPVGVVGYPNFAYWRYRLGLALLGRLPVSESLPYEWYDSPNIHVVTIRDFEALCAKEGIRIEHRHVMADDPCGRLLIGVGLSNLGAERALVRVARS